MRHMTREEIIDFIKYYTWGTLIGVEPGGSPYAVELSYGFDGDAISTAAPGPAAEWPAA